jgi:hypothetical protein
MKVYGRSADIPDKLLTLQEVSFLAGPEQLRSLARFLLAQAESQESGQGGDHAHYSDSREAIPGNVEVVVADPAVLSD